MGDLSLKYPAEPREHKTENFSMGLSCSQKCKKCMQSQPDSVKLKIEKVSVVLLLLEKPLPSGSVGALNNYEATHYNQDIVAELPAQQAPLWFHPSCHAWMTNSLFRSP